MRTAAVVIGCILALFMALAIADHFLVSPRHHRIGHMERGE
jgi:hypothetical protein